MSATVYDIVFPLGEVCARYPFVDNGRRAVLTADFAYRDTIDGQPPISVIVPARFVTDFNSTPRFLWAYFPPQECPEAGIVHDFLYRFPGDRTREQIDRIHRRIMELKGERKAKRVLAWSGIRAGGWKPWGDYRRQEIPHA